MACGAELAKSVEGRRLPPITARGDGASITAALVLPQIPRSPRQKFFGTASWFGLRAIETAAELGYSLVVRGALMSRGVGELPAPYLPNGLLG